MTFLELLVKGTNQPVAFNPQHVSAVVRNPAGDGAIVYILHAEEGWNVTEPYGRVLELWKQALTVEI